MASPCQSGILTVTPPLRSLSTEAIIPGAVADASLWRTLRPQRTPVSDPALAPTLTDEGIEQRCYAAQESVIDTFDTMPPAENVCFLGKAGSDRCTVGTTRMTRNGHETLSPGKKMCSLFSCAD